MLIATAAIRESVWWSRRRRGALSLAMVAAAISLCCAVRFLDIRTAWLFITLWLTAFGLLCGGLGIPLVGFVSWAYRRGYRDIFLTAALTLIPVLGGMSTVTSPAVRTLLLRSPQALAPETFASWGAFAFSMTVAVMTSMRWVGVFPPAHERMRRLALGAITIGTGVLALCCAIVGVVLASRRIQGSQADGTFLVFLMGATVYGAACPAVLVSAVAVIPRSPLDVRYDAAVLGTQLILEGMDRHADLDQQRVRIVGRCGQLWSLWSGILHLAFGAARALGISLGRSPQGAQSRTSGVGVCDWVECIAVVAALASLSAFASLLSNPYLHVSDATSHAVYELGAAVLTAAYAAAVVGRTRERAGKCVSLQQAGRWLGGIIWVGSALALCMVAQTSGGSGFITWSLLTSLPVGMWCCSALVSPALRGWWRTAAATVKNLRTSTD